MRACIFFVLGLIACSPSPAPSTTTTTIPPTPPPSPTASVAPAIDTGAAALQRCLEATPAVDAAFTALEGDLAAKKAIDRARIDALWSCIESVAASIESIDDKLITRIHEDARLVRDASYGPRAKELLTRVTPTVLSSTVTTRLLTASIRTAVHLVSDLQYEAAIPELIALLEKQASNNLAGDVRFALARDVRYALLRMPRATEKYVIPALQAEPKQPTPPPPSNDPGDTQPTPPTLSLKEEIFLQILGDIPRPAARDAIHARLKGETDKSRRTAIIELAAANGVDDARTRTALIDAIMTTPANTWGMSNTDAFHGGRVSLILLTYHLHDAIVIDALMKFVSTFKSSTKKEDVDVVGSAIYSICEAAPRAKMAAAAALARSATKGKRACPTPEVDKILDRCREDAKCYATAVGETTHPTSMSVAYRAALHGDASTLRTLMDIAATNNEYGTLISIEETVASLATKLAGPEAATAAAYIEEVLAKRGFRATTGVPYDGYRWAMPLFMTAARLRARSLP